ncbi:MAG: hypothetical protein FJX75_20570 [Armatimonadetes bacterium]|nr:hypothetical protein [Armatimonadota bacterium]
MDRRATCRLPANRLASVLGTILFLVPALAKPAPTVSGARASLEAVGAPGAWTGVTLRSGDAAIATITLGAGGRWRARDVSVADASLTFRGFDTSDSGGTPTLAATSFVEFRLTRDDLSPRVSFRFDLTAFDSSAWEKALGRPSPLHFLDCSLDRAEIYYFHGLLAPTPRVDPYPFSWRDMRANWADGWSTAPAVAALTVPAVALWQPTTGHVAAYCFQEMRNTGRADHDLSVAYRWDVGGGPNDAFSLIWPRQRGFNELTLPSAPVTITGGFDLLCDANTGPTADVNRVVFDHLWQVHRDALPTVPRMNDLGWMVERQGFKEGPPGAGIFGRVPKSGGSFGSLFFQDDTQVFGGSFRGVDLAYRRNDEAALALLRREVETMLSRAIWETIDGDECVYWKYPSEGGWEDWIGGDRADTVHNVQQFGFAGALLAMYLREPSDRLWWHVEGLYNWSRHYVYTRGDICDIPCSMFTLQTSQLALNFLMNLHYALQDDPDPHKRQMAQEAFDLAVTVVWRNANVTTGDPDPTDTLDPTFLMPGNQARFWLGQVSWAELCDVFRSMIVMYAETGDPRFKYYVRGALDKWWSGFESDGYHTAENLDVFGETAGKAVRTGLHGPQDSFWEWAYPVGDSILHVTAGRAGAIAFCKGTTSLDVADYRFRPPANFAFRVAGTHEGPFRMVFSSPFRDLSGLAVQVNGEPAEAHSAGAYNEHLLFLAEAGATVEIGAVGDAPLLAAQPVPTHPAGFRAIIDRDLGLHSVDLGPSCNTQVNRSWADPGSWAGLSAGPTYAGGVPCAITDPDANQGKMAVRGASVPVGRRVEGLLLLCSRLGPNDVRIELSSGQIQPIDPQSGLLVRDGKPLRKWELWLYPYVAPPRAALTAVHVGKEASLFALTLAPERVLEVKRVADLAAAAARKQAAEVFAATDREHMVAECRRRVADECSKKGAVRAAFVPPHGRAAARIRDALEDLRIPSIALRPEELVDPTLFTVADYPLLIYTGDENYLRTVKQPGDAEQALLDYVRRGGTLVVMGACRPFTYPDDLTAPRAEGRPRESVLLGRQFGLDLLGPGEARGGAIGFEQPPAGNLTFRLETDQDVLLPKIQVAQREVRLLPDTIPFPATGDRRYRPATADALPEGYEFIPVLTLYDDAGTRYGPAVAMLRPREQGAPGGVVHVWGTLLTDAFPYADTVLHQTLARAAQLSGPASPRPATATTARAAAVGILPLTDKPRVDLITRVCRDLGQDCAEVLPDAFVDGAAFSPDRFPVAVHAPTPETYVDTWRLPGDGAAAYVRYVENGGFLIACGNATQFWYPVTWTPTGWEMRHPLEPRMLQAIGLPIEYGFERPVGRISLQPAADRTLFPSRLDVSAIGDQRWRALMPTRGAEVEFTPLAYLTDENGRRYEGCAAALIRRHRPNGRPGAILYIWGNLIDGELADPIMRAALKYALSDVQR